MAISKRLSALKRGIEALRGQFLPPAFDPTASYPNRRRVHAHTRAFLVLSHAEIEGYLEDWAKGIARAAEKAWNATGKITPPLGYLFATTLGRITVTETLAGRSDTRTLLKTEAVKMFEAYYKSIKDNNGIKEKNVLSLFLPLGVDSGALGSALLSELDNFGKLRGTHAHNSAKAVVSVPDPETEYKRVTELVKLLEPLDLWLVQYLRTVR